MAQPFQEENGNKSVVTTNQMIGFLQEAGTVAESRLGVRARNALMKTNYLNMNEQQNSR